VKKRHRVKAVSLAQRKDRIRQRLTARGVKSIKHEIAKGYAEPRAPKEEAAAEAEAAPAEEAADE